MTSVIEITSFAYANLAFTTPFHRCGRRHCRLVGLDGLEPSTSRLSGVRSNHLSYKPILFTHLAFGSNHLLTRFGPRHCRVVEMMGIEPMTPCLQGRCSPS